MKEMKEKIKEWADLWSIEITYIPDTWYTLFHIDIGEHSILRNQIRDLEKITNMKLHAIDRMGDRGLQIWLEL